ncbi:hypothetical protein K6W36_07365 [Acetobacter senegalensis]|uniref:helix-turn-helix transcriptional regulator n=1 Tax=Acetobacter senegalensis TaxID=446692 RepID=UPI001EDC248D|nr:hypothetical protein [Acetobacter senegalensis]MCG4260403.1 hypothetical protein [Acetobacter senegalensis]
MAKPVMPDWGRLLRRELAAAYLGVSASKFSQLVQEGVLPAPRTFPGSTVNVWDRRELDGWADSLAETETSNGWDHTAA